MLQASPETIGCFPANTRFKYSWRKYQQRVLDELEEHLTDKHLHVIAPPGSGKTVLGLEVAIRLNQPTLILAPTIAIRNQWIQRFCELFLQTQHLPDWISRDIRKPGFLTVVTYQGLHAACNNLRIEENEPEDEEAEAEGDSVKSSHPNLDNIVNGLQAQQVKTIVVDEAHHLKNEWWQTLTKVKAKLKPVIVGLTATPPYDVSANEWLRYLELNGPVDTEISVPELVIEGDLCPHQDYVYFTLPTENESQTINYFRQNAHRLFEELKHDETLVKALEQHPVWQNPTAHLEWIYSNLPCYSAALIYLHANHREIPETHLEVVGDKKLEVPALDYIWLETVLDFYLYKEKSHFQLFEEHRHAIEKKLRRKGAIERRQINLRHNKKVSGFLTSSISKLNGIKTIVDFEHQKLGPDLRLVILSDFIRKEFLVSSSQNELELNKIGVIPIFEKLRRENNSGLKMAVLTGSLVIIPTAACAAFAAKAMAYGISNITATPVPYDKDYVSITQTEQLKHDIVHIVTQLFQEGGVEVLIGTKSLLGEGWDAPAINALVLASFVGSFVLSNQMRGRAIRTQKGNQDKTGNIWHLVCVDPTAATGGDDFDLLKRRFRTFVGVSFGDEPGIENGTGRLNLPENIHDRSEVEAKNNETFRFAGDRESLKARWELALQQGVSLVEEIKIPFLREGGYRKTKRLYYNKTIGYLVGQLFSGLLIFGESVFHSLLRSARQINSLKDFFMLLSILGFSGVLYFGWEVYSTIRIYLRYRDISKDIQKIGEALVLTLIKAGCVHTSATELYVQAEVDEQGAVYCHLEGGTTFEKSSFINALQEVIGPVDNPRYVIRRKSTLMLFLRQEDYHSVPELIGKNKNLATYFRDQWQTLVGSCDLLFTRTLEGRKLLLKSRVQSLASQFEHKVEHINKWR